MVLTARAIFSLAGHQGNIEAAQFFASSPRPVLEKSKVHRSKFPET
jgi:hypothetical protein